MARFTPTQLPDDVSASVAWLAITDALKAGNKSIEVLSRVVEGEDVWEVRAWDSIRQDRSNSARASSETDY